MVLFIFREVYVFITVSRRRSAMRELALIIVSDVECLTYSQLRYREWRTEILRFFPELLDVEVLSKKRKEAKFITRF